ncbi:YdcF family protein [Actinomadura parmotrematis]|uniref:YdcF family protein n=1 Tax=Actinomadura parmotrematis TaxID=2864039 RepID=A0ABS7FUZ3_9ACTN|nr:YdcF family protein [Actinomadura parmotrematis]MBW8483504.1 YdcF family protein [Actinomadura parmotrematis]
MTLEIEESGGEPDGPHGGDGGEGARRGRRGRKGRKPRSRAFVITMGVIATVVGVLVLVPLAVGFRVWWQARQDERPRSDAIIVLGAAQYNGVPSPILKWRLQHALDLYRDGVAPRIVTVGGKAPGDNFTEADSGRRWLITKGGLPADRVVAVPSGRDTLQSFEAVGKVYKQRGWRSGVIVTDPWHGLRSKRMAEDNGIEAASSPTRSGPSVMTRDTQFHYIVRETGGYLSYVLLGKSVKVPGETSRTIPDPASTASPSAASPAATPRP